MQLTLIPIGTDKSSSKLSTATVRDLQASLSRSVMLSGHFVVVAASNMTVTTSLLPASRQELGNRRKHPVVDH